MNDTAPLSASKTRSLEVPSPQRLVAELVELLEVTPIGEDRFEGRRKKGGVGRVFGGQVVAQALASAECTVAEDREPHSLHAYFLRGGSEDYPIQFRVDRQFDGGSFSNRRVVAYQEGRPIFNLAASFHRRESGFEHHDAIPDVPSPESLEAVPGLARRYADLASKEMVERLARTTAIELRPCEPRLWLGLEVGEPKLHTWFRTAAALPSNDPKLHRAALAYASDMVLLGTCGNPHRLDWTSDRLQSASLDHALWFHEHARADEWLLYATDSPWAGGARGFNRGRIYTREGRLVADVAQEGLIRQVAPKD